MMYTPIHTNTAVIVGRPEMNVRKTFRNIKGNHWW